MQGISGRLDLANRSEAKKLKVGRPKELLVVPRVHQLLLYVADRALNVANKFTAVPTLQLSNLRLVVEDRILEYLLNVLVADLWRFFTRRAQVLTTINSEVDLGVAEILRLIVR